MKDTEIKGWKKIIKLTPNVSGTSKVIWFREDLADIDLINGELQDHFTTCYLLAGEIQRQCSDEIAKIAIGTGEGQGKEDKDTSIQVLFKNEKRVAIEYEHPGTRK